MLIPRRIYRSRNWRHFFHSMTAFLGLSALIFFCGTVFRVSTNPVSDMGPLSSNEDGLGFEDLKLEDRGTWAKGTDPRGSAIQRHNRALQYIKSHEYRKDSVDDLTVNNKPPSVHTRTFNALQFKPEKVGSHSATNKDQQLNPGMMAAQGDSPFYPENAKDTTFPSDLSESSTSGLAKRLPKALIIGVKKAGTRALLEFLRIHPQIETTGPEPHFFDQNFDKGFGWYRDRMPKTREDQITIEKTPAYFVTPEVPKLVFDMDPNIKLILVVRDPVTRTISDYCQTLARRTMPPFEEMAMLDENLGLLNTSWGAIKRSVYAKHMENWLQVFPLEQFHIVDGKKLVEDPVQELAKVEKFLGLPSYINDSHFHLRGFKGIFPCIMKDGKPHCLNEKSKGRDHPPVKEHVLQRLRDFYRPFNAKFYQMINRSFDWDDNV